MSHVCGGLLPNLETGHAQPLRELNYVNYLSNTASTVTILLLSHVTLLVDTLVICYFLFVSMHYGTTSVVDIYFSLFAMFTDFYDVPYHST